MYKRQVLRCVHVFNEPISKACLDDWLDGSEQINVRSRFMCITDEKANKIIEKIKELAPHLSTDIDNKNIILPDYNKQKHTIQVMYYGAPGTGKSYSIASLIKKSYPGYTCLLYTSNSRTISPIRRQNVRKRGRKDRIGLFYLF